MLKEVYKANNYFNIYLYFLKFIFLTISNDLEGTIHVSLYFECGFSISTFFGGL
jgi:hypothetical protein